MWLQHTSFHCVEGRLLSSFLTGNPFASIHPSTDCVANGEVDWLISKAKVSADHVTVTVHQVEQELVEPDIHGVVAVVAAAAKSVALVAGVGDFGLLQPAIVIVAGATVHESGRWRPR